MSDSPEDEAALDADAKAYHADEGAAVERAVAQLQEWIDSPVSTAPVDPFAQAIIAGAAIAVLAALKEAEGMAQRAGPELAKHINRAGKAEALNARLREALKALVRAATAEAGTVDRHPKINRAAVTAAALLAEADGE